MKLNNKGFVASTLMYSLLILFLFLILGLIALLSNRKMILDKLKNDIKEEVNSTKKYTYYENGTPIYFNPVTNKICGNYTEENSLNETKTGCLKWYIFNDDINKASVNMILDHNTTYKVAYNSAGTNSEPKEAKEELDKLVSESKWKVTPRLITADEIAKITGNDGFDSKTSTNRLEFVDTTWLYDYLDCCKTRGKCNYEDNNTAGYWTSTKFLNNNISVWLIWSYGIMEEANSNISVHSGIRPVITIDKKKLSESFVTTYDYTGNAQTFVAPVSGNYKIELWGAQAGEYDTSNAGSRGGYSSGFLNVNKNTNLYIYVGERPKTNNPSWNGGGSSSYERCAGGGATDVRLINGNWNNFDSLKSRIIVAGGASGCWPITSLQHGGGLLSGFRSGIYNSSAATQTHGGVGGNTTSLTNCYSSHISPGIAESGKFGIAGNATNFGSGGGGGYYGGGAGIHKCSSDAGGTGSGGSSFISGHNGCVAITNDSTEDNIIQRNDSNGNKCTDGTTDITCSYHYSGY